MARLKLIPLLFASLALGALCLCGLVTDRSLDQEEAAAVPDQRAKSGDASLPISPSPEAVLPATSAPELIFKDRVGRLHSLSQLRGKVVVLSFWGIDCDHCPQYLAHINDLGKKFAGEAVMVALDVLDTRQIFAGWVARHRQFWAILFVVSLELNGRQMAAKSYDVTWLPETFVIDRKGKIIKALIGYDGPTPQLANAVRNALKK